RGAAGFGRGQAGSGRDGDADIVIVEIGGRDVGGVAAAVLRIAAGGGGGGDGIGDVAVVDEIIDAGDGDGLGGVPVGGGEREAGGGGRAFGGVAGREADGHVGGRLAVEDDRGAGRAASFGGGQA